MNLSTILASTLILASSFSMELKYWAEEFNKPFEEKSISVQHHRLGRLYLRGYPKGAWGTRLFPVTSFIFDDDTKNNSVTTALRNAYTGTESVAKDYSAFRENIKNAFCHTNETFGDSCCRPTWEKKSCTSPPKVVEIITRTLIDPVHGMPTMFLYFWCTKAWVDYYEGKDVNAAALKTRLLSTCPNTCIGNPCHKLENTKNSQYCEVTGPFENDYKCDCNENSQWDSANLFCRPTAICNNKQINPCHLENTIRCVTIDDHQAKCICKAEFMGTDCSVPRDACTERLNKSQATGNQNCQVRFGNDCTGRLGTDQYNCTCRYGYEPLLTMSEDNCLSRQDPCQNYFGIEALNKYSVDLDRSLRGENETEVTFEMLASKKRSAFIIHRGLMCLNGGQCITSADSTRATCLCPTSADGSPLYLGSNCEIPVGTWSAWSSLSSCIPMDCGQTRYRWRRRRCLNVTSSEDLVGAGSVNRAETVEVRANYSPPIRCFGTSEEVIPCDPLDPCTILRLPGYLRTEILNYTTLYYFGCITLGYLLFSLSAWYVFATPILKTIQKRKKKQTPTVVTVG